MVLSVVFSCCLLQRVSSRAAETCMRSPGNLTKKKYANSSNRVEESPFSVKCPDEVRANLSLSQGRLLFFLTHASSHFLSEASGSLGIFFSFIFILFIQFTSTIHFHTIKWLQVCYYPPLQLGVVAIEKGAFWSPSTRSPTLLYLQHSFAHSQKIPSIAK